jgi:hypothetical protein
MSSQNLPPTTDSGEARFLRYLPDVIFVEFEDVDWQIKGFDRGVLPIFPEDHEWVISKKTKSAVSRRGFRLLPDFASTAFMVQGASLPAALADCGDVNAPGSTRSLVNAYVILSRVKRAHGLALLRAFSPELFNTGVAPGPHCLMKFLRCEHNSSSGAETYSTEDAQEEYKYRTDKIAARIKFIDECGMPLLCHGCNNRLCPEYYGQGTQVDGGDDDIAESFWTDDRLKSYWEQGCRRRCGECEKLMGLSVEEKSKECKQCDQMFPQGAEDTNICPGCTNWREQAEHCCERCKKNKAWGDVHFLHNTYTDEAARPQRGVGRVVCRDCAPELTELKCYICGEAKLALDFPKLEQRQNIGKAYRRCWSCFTCGVCGKKHGDKTGFLSGTRHCFGCAQKTCDVCDTKKKVGAFPEYQLDNASRKNQNAFLRCRECSDCGKCKKHFGAEHFDGTAKLCMGVRGERSPLPV